MSKIERLLTEVTVAQNKTTHAVRAFVRFLFIQLSATTLAGFFWLLSTASIDQNSCLNLGTKCEANTPLQILAVATWIIGIFLSSRAGWAELEKSKV